VTPTRRAVAGLFVSFVFVVSYAAAQITPPPNDPAEMATGDAHVVSKRDQPLRQSISSLKPAPTTPFIVRTDRPM